MRPRDENKEQAVRQKALQLIVKEGFDGLSMHKLAKAAGVSAATIYIYYRDREDLILKLCEEENHKMSDATLAGFDPDMSFDEGLKVQWLNRAKYCLENPESMHFLEQVKYSPLHEKVRARMDPRFHEAMHRFVTNAIARKELVKLPLEIYWSIAFAPMYQLVKFHMSKAGMPGRGDFVLDETKLNQALALVLKALKP